MVALYIFFMINQYVLNYNLAFYFCVLGKSNFFVHICKLCDWFTTVHVYIYWPLHHIPNKSSHCAHHGPPVVKGTYYSTAPCKMLGLNQDGLMSVKIYWLVFLQQGTFHFLPIEPNLSSLRPCKVNQCSNGQCHKILDCVFFVATTMLTVSA